MDRKLAVYKYNEILAFIGLSYTFDNARMHVTSQQYKLND